jgi:hypothetical protein
MQPEFPGILRGVNQKTRAKINILARIFPSGNT